MWAQMGLRYVGFAEGCMLLGLILLIVVSPTSYNIVPLALDCLLPFTAILATFVVWRKRTTSVVIFGYTMLETLNGTLTVAALFWRCVLAYRCNTEPTTPLWCQTTQDVRLMYLLIATGSILVLASGSGIFLGCITFSYIREHEAEDETLIQLEPGQETSKSDSDGDDEETSDTTPLHKKDRVRHRKHKQGP